MPTPWHSDDDVEQAYGLLDVVLDECALNSVLALLGGDWNARLGACKNGDDSAVLVIWGSEGTMFVDRLRIFSGLETNMPVEDSWTCTRVGISVLVACSLNTTSFGMTIVWAQA